MYHPLIHEEVARIHAHCVKQASEREKERERGDEGRERRPVGV